VIASQFRCTSKSVERLQDNSVKRSDQADIDSYYAGKRRSLSAVENSKRSLSDGLKRLESLDARVPDEAVTGAFSDKPRASVDSKDTMATQPNGKRALWW
jgi:hypothetical protein